MGDIECSRQRKVLASPPAGDAQDAAIYSPRRSTGCAAASCSRWLARVDSSAGAQGRAATRRSGHVTKSGKVRSVPMAPDVATALRARTARALDPMTTCLRRHRRRQVTAAAAPPLPRTLQRAGLRRCASMTAHTWDADDCQTDIRRVQEWMGHATSTTGSTAHAQRDDDARSSRRCSDAASPNAQLKLTRKRRLVVDGAGADGRETLVTACPLSSLSSIEVCARASA